MTTGGNMIGICFTHGNYAGNVCQECSQSSMSSNLIDGYNSARGFAVSILQEAIQQFNSGLHTRPFKTLDEAVPYLKLMQKYYIEADKN